MNAGKSLFSIIQPHLSWKKITAATIFGPAITKEVTKVLPSFLELRINKAVNHLSGAGYRIIFNSAIGGAKNVGAAIFQFDPPKQTPNTSSPLGANKAAAVPATPGPKPSTTQVGVRGLVGFAAKTAKLAYANLKDAPLDAVKGIALGVKDLAPPSVIIESELIAHRIKELPTTHKLLGGICVALGTLGVYRYFRPAASSNKAAAQPQEEEDSELNPEAASLKEENEQLRFGLMRLKQHIAQQQTQPAAQPVVLKQYFTGTQLQAPDSVSAANTQPKKQAPASSDEESDTADSEPTNSTSVSVAITTGGKPASSTKQSSSATN
jgi:hypothetical protein